jgi:hypothetical protein
MGIVHNPKHQWYYKFGQQADEVLIFKQSDNHGSARICAHSAFKDKEYENADARESIELRVLLLWPNHSSVKNEW